MNAISSRWNRNESRYRGMNDRRQTNGDKKAMRIIITLEVSAVLELSSDAEIKQEIRNLIKDAHYYGLIEKYGVEVIR